jgi:beta-lactam-binding protein with PASTA domain
MSSEEDRLARLLKRAVPEPPVRLSADQITTRSARPAAKSWRLPALAAAAVVAIGVTVGLVAAQLPGSRAGQSPQFATGASASPSPHVSASCQGRTVTVPNVVGESMDAAGAIVQDVGLTEGIYFAPTARVPSGTVMTQSLAAGSKAVPGAEVELEIASTPSTSTAAPIDPGMQITATPTPLSPCQAVTGTPAAPDATQSVPNVVGMTAHQAHVVARGAGFSVSTVFTPVPASRHVPPGTIFAQEPAAGSSARAGSGMILYAAPAS